MGILELVQNHCHIKHLVMLDPQKGMTTVPPPHMSSLYYIERIRKQSSRNAKKKTVFLLQRLCVNPWC